jgi:multidrug efflux pump subunit AcrA (membrane-fusion protein)
MLDYFKRLKAFQIIATIVIVGLLYGAFNLYTKIQFYKSFANQTRTTSVAVEEVKIDSINKIYPATSVIEAKKSYNVVSKTDGILNDIFFKESSFVEKGDKLFSILSTSSIGEILITAPFNGYVGITDYKIGDKLKNGDLLLTLDDMSSMKAFIYLPEKILPQISKNIKYIASSKLFPEQKYFGVISNIDQRVNRDSRTIRAYAIIDNKNNNLRPGLMLNIDIILEEIEATMLIPEESVLTSQDFSYVFVIEEDIAKLKEVNIGISSNGMIQILSGISSGDKVVTLGHEKLKDGSKIKIIEN